MTISADIHRLTAMSKYQDANLSQHVDFVKNGISNQMVAMRELLYRVREQTNSPENISTIDAGPTNDESNQLVKQLSRIESSLDEFLRDNDKRQENLESIRKQMQQSFMQQKMLEFQQSDEFVYDISILGREDNEEGPDSITPCRAILDTGCHGNWVATRVVEQAGLQDSVEEKEGSDVFETFSGNTIEPQGKIELTFFLATATTSSQKTRTETFNVFDQLPVELVLGKEFIVKQFTVVSKHALGLIKQGKLTAGVSCKHKYLLRHIVFTTHSCYRGNS